MRVGFFKKRLAVGARGLSEARQRPPDAIDFIDGVEAMVFIGANVARAVSGKVAVVVECFLAVAGQVAVQGGRQMPAPGGRIVARDEVEMVESPVAIIDQVAFQLEALQRIMLLRLQG